MDPEAKLSDHVSVPSHTGAPQSELRSPTIFCFPSPSELRVAFKNSPWRKGGRGSSSSSLPSNVNKHLKNSHQNHEISFVFRPLQAGKQPQGVGSQHVFGFTWLFNFTSSSRLGGLLPLATSQTSLSFIFGEILFLSRMNLKEAENAFLCPRALA